MMNDKGIIKRSFPLQEHVSHFLRELCAAGQLLGRGAEFQRGPVLSCPDVARDKRQRDSLRHAGILLGNTTSLAR